MNDFTNIGSNLTDKISSNFVYDDFSKNKLEGNREGQSNYYIFFTDEKMGRKNADKIKYFDPLTFSDKIVLSKFKFPELNGIKFSHTSNLKQLKNSKNDDSNIIFDAKKGNLIYDANGSDAGLGDGGIFAQIKDSSTVISADDFLYL